MALIEDFVAGRTPPELYQAYLTPLFETWSDALIEASPPHGRVLDLACGTGIVTRRIAAEAKVDSVVGIDIAQPMIEAAMAATTGEMPVKYLIASADQIDFPDNSFQSAFCQQGLQFFPDKVAALNETERLLAPGASAVFAVWTSGSNGNPVFGAFEDIVAEELGADLVPFGPFSLGSQREIEQFVESSKLGLIALAKEERVVRLPDPKTLVLFDLMFLGRPAADGTMHPLFDPADSSKDEQIARIISKLASATAQFLQPGGDLLAPSSAHIIVLGKD
ncbi:class I SAM-dependent methyltransferase [Erythrobacter mangrovi]|uniref:Methyltransferase domain-containing protein n=1 Tax=Erythrobacter mangrovi TaxID=2739433 RepID=A0A7D4B5Z3_9SPHN|nr:class I SAM-dependent methyltransferase [Erythrobacter mangrovi]QKG69883.1 methyltransferase domain-containing protein [Erythrobacter mangrovi]